LLVTFRASESASSPPPSSPALDLYPWVVPRVSVEAAALVGLSRSAADSPPAAEAVVEEAVAAAEAVRLPAGVREPVAE